MSKPILCIDFDGVIHSYDKGWQDGSIYGDVVSGFFEWMFHASERFKLVVYSSRSKTVEGRHDMAVWIADKYILSRKDNTYKVRVLCPTSNAVSLEIGSAVLEFAHEKPPAFLTIDDRAVEFGGRWDSPFLHPQYLAEFKPWNQREA